MLWVTNCMIDKTSDNNLHNIAIMQSCTRVLVHLRNGASGAEKRALSGWKSTKAHWGPSALHVRCATRELHKL